jgi:hypothetical protein
MHACIEIVLSYREREWCAYRYTRKKSGKLLYAHREAYNNICNYDTNEKPGQQNIFAVVGSAKNGPFFKENVACNNRVRILRRELKGEGG